MRSLLALSCSLVLVLSACGTRETTGNNQARVRNQPPAQCTEADFQGCPEIAFEQCADGSEPVIDYSSDCCPHFSCQPACTPELPCPLGPAPVCPPGSTLVILTASDCCPAYRCEGGTNCETADVACPLAMPWCGEGVEPIIVGYNDGCCPIYQCPCDVPVAGGGTLPDDAPRSDPTLCGCTFPACAPGEQLQCWGDNICGYPCECVPLQAQCVTDADCPQYDCGDPNTDCGVQMRCDTSMCLPPPGCDPATGELCPPVCAGVCVGGTTYGCKSDFECPVGQRCDMMCAGWACTGYPDDPSCACPPDMSNCRCDETGTCYSEECTGQCVPAAVCTGTCAAPRCSDAIEIGVDECGCPLYECGSCQPDGAPCAVPDCEGAIVIGTDPNCCPTFCCPDASGSCPTPEPRPL